MLSGNAWYGIVCPAVYKTPLTYCVFPGATIKPFARLGVLPNAGPNELVVMALETEAVRRVSDDVLEQPEQIRCILRLFVDWVQATARDLA